MSDLSPAYRITAKVVLVVVTLGSVYYIYRRRRQRRLESAMLFEAEKADGARPWSRRSLITRTNLESTSGSGAEGEEGRHSFDFRSPMPLTDGSLPAVPPLAFNDARLVRQPEASLALLPPQLGPADLPAQPSAAFLPSHHVRRGSVAAAPHAVAPRHDSAGFYSVRSSLTSSKLPPSYHSRYPGPEDSQSSLVAPLNQRPASIEGQSQGEGVEGAAACCPTRAVDGGVRLAGGRPDEGDSGVSGSNCDEGSVMPPTYHDW